MMLAISIINNSSIMAKTYDINALIEELELDKEDIVELMDDFKDFIKDTVPQLEEAINSNNCAEARSHAHSIKGSAGNLRINFIYETAKVMQDLADAEDSNRLKELLPELKIQIEEFVEEVKDI
jgi:HPt (histidine-containing phosphotransfer) domain-containing protein